MEFPTYDPYRADVTGYVARLKKERSEKAQEIIEARKHYRQATTLPLSVRNKLARQFLSRELPRTSDKALRQLAINNWRYAENDYGFGRGDSEYYSACGYDDYVAEKKNHARSLALEIWRTVGRF